MPFFFFNDTATTEIYTLSLHDALPISAVVGGGDGGAAAPGEERRGYRLARSGARDGLPERAQAAGEAAALAEEGDEERRRGSGSGLRSDAGGREAGEPGAGNSAARSLDSTIREGVAGDGRDGGRVAVEREPGSSGGQRVRVAQAVRAPLGPDRTAGDLRRRGAVRRSSGAGGGRCGPRGAQARAGAGRRRERK